MSVPHPSSPQSAVSPELLDRIAAQLESMIAEYQERVGDEQGLEDISGAVYAQVAETAEKALARIADGSYGLCEECGSQIPEERLEFLVPTLVCIRCANSRS